MPGRWKDTDFLSISSRVRVLESRLLTRDGAERMLAAPTGEGAARVLAELGYPELSRLTPPALEAMLARARAETFRDMEEGAPERGLVTVFRIRYDYHNAKALVKAQAVEAEAGPLLAEGGRYPPSQLRACMSGRTWRRPPFSFGRRWSGPETCWPPGAILRGPTSCWIRPAVTRCSKLPRIRAAGF